MGMFLALQGQFKGQKHRMMYIRTVTAYLCMGATFTPEGTWYLTVLDPGRHRAHEHKLVAAQALK